MARPAKITPERTEIICNALRRGESIERACAIGNIVPDTFYRWMQIYSEFSQAVKKAQADYEEWQMNGILADAKKSLVTLILGQEYEEIKTVYEPDPRNPNNPKIKSQTRTTKRIPPNATAIIFALCNRDPDNWKNRINNEISGKLETEGESKLDLSGIPDDLLAQVVECVRKKK